MSITFTKLFSSITESTVWCEPDRTRLVWITMLAMADRRGRIFASIPGLANRARVPVEDCRVAIDTFLSPDRYSRTPDNDGRRIEPIDGGWRLLNHEKYRNLKDEESVKESKRKWWNENRGKGAKLEQESQTRPHSTQAEAEATPIEPSSQEERGEARATRLPHHWWPSEALAEETRKIQPDWTGERFGHELAQFVDHYRSKGERRADWDAAWRKWVRGARGERGQGPPQVGSKAEQRAKWASELTGKDHGQRTIDGTAERVG